MSARTRDVRNFWLDGRIDGRSTRIEGGPVSKDGGFWLDVHMRDDGNIETPVKIQGHAMPDGSLRLVVTAYGKGTVVDCVADKRDTIGADVVAHQLTIASKR